MIMKVMSKKKKNSNYSQGFTMIDEVFLSLIGGLLQTKVAEIISIDEKIKVQKEVLATIKMSALITTQRSYTDYITAVKQALPEFFGFEGLGVLFFDSKAKDLFTMD